MSIRSRLSCTKLSVCSVSTREALSVLHKTGGKDGSLNTSCSMAPIKKPASATSFSANASDAKGLRVTRSNFLDDQHIGAN